MAPIRLQCPACTATVRISAETAAAYPVVRCAKCKGLINTATATCLPLRQPNRLRPLRRKPTTHLDPGLIAALVLVVLVVVAGVTIYTIRKDRPPNNDPFAALPPEARRSLDDMDRLLPPGDDLPIPPRRLPPRPSDDAPSARPSDQAPPAADRPNAQRSRAERESLKLLEVFETTTALLNRATTPADVRNAGRRCRVLLDEYEKLHSTGDHITTEETKAEAGRILATYGPRLVAAYQRLEAAYARLQSDPALARAFEDAFANFELPSPPGR